MKIEEIREKVKDILNSDANIPVMWAGSIESIPEDKRVVDMLDLISTIRREAVEEVSYNFPTHKGGLTIDHNPHKGLYESVEEYLNSDNGRGDFINEGDRQKMIDTDEIWECQWYPITPIGFICVYAPTFIALIDYFNSLEKGTNNE